MDSFSAITAVNDRSGTLKNEKYLKEMKLWVL